MPLLFEKNIDNVSFAVWKIEESLRMFLEWLDDKNVEKECASVKSKRRRLEIAASRYLLKYILGADYENILHDENGKPYLASGKYKLSISHTDGYVAISFGSVNTGIDIERISDRAFRLVRHYLSEDEIRLMDTCCPVIDAVVRWSAKESVYKVIGKSVYNFKDTIFTSAFSLKNDSYVSVIIRDGISGITNSKNVFFRVYDSFVLTICL